MSMTTEQAEWIRQHGVTKCPPGPEFRMVWSGRLRRRAQRDRSGTGTWEAVGHLRVRSITEPAFKEQWLVNSEQ